MTKTFLKHYLLVWQTAREVSLAKEGVWNEYFTVGEVMRRSGMTRPTVIKYVNQGCIDGYFEKIQYDKKSTPLYRLLIKE